MFFFLLASFAIFTSSGRAVYKQQNHVESVSEIRTASPKLKALAFSPALKVIFRLPGLDDSDD